MSPFVVELRSRLEESWSRNLKKTAFWEHLESGTLTIDHYASYLKETYHYTRRSALIQASSIPHFQIQYRDMVRGFLKHAFEEESHYRLCLNDLASLGHDRDEIEGSSPLPATEGYLGFIFNRIAFVNPLSYLGYLYNLEYMAISVGPKAVELLKMNLGLKKDSLSFLLVHAHEDIDHTDDLTTIIEKHIKDERDRKEIIYTALTASALYASMIDSAFKHTPRSV